MMKQRWRDMVRSFALPTHRRGYEDKSRQSAVDAIVVVAVVSASLLDRELVHEAVIVPAEIKTPLA